MHACAFAYTGREGAVHGFGLNLYATGEWGGRHFDGERLLALDWHDEKLAERGKDGRWLPRSKMRTVCWPHIHLCAWRLEFWPWVREPTDACTLAMAEAQRARERRRQEQAGPLDREVEEAVTNAIGELDLPAKLEAGCSVASLAQEVAKGVLHFFPAELADGIQRDRFVEKVHRVAGRTLGRVLPKQCSRSKH